MVSFHKLFWLHHSSILKKMTPRVAFWVDRHNCVNKPDVTQLKFQSARTMDYKWQSKHRVCSAHFSAGRRYGTNNIPAVFPRKDKRTGQIVWPVGISYQLNAEATEATVSSSNKTENADVACSSCEQVESEASDQKSEDTRREKVAKLRTTVIAKNFPRKKPVIVK